MKTSLLASSHRARGTLQNTGGNKVSMAFMALDPACYNTDQQGKMYPLDVRPAPKEGTHSWYFKPGQNLRAKEVAGPTREPSVALSTRFVVKIAF